MSAAPTFHHTGLTVSDIERALGFWGEALGGTIVVRQEQHGGYFGAIIGESDAHVKMAQLELRPGGHRVELFEFAGNHTRDRYTRPVEVGFAHICIATDDVEAVMSRLEAAGGSRVSDAVEIDDGVNAGGRAVYVRDPDGHVVEVFQPPLQVA